MKAHAIIGANYGDEGKGLMTDYFCEKLDADLVVRFNGGAQAGHTVVTPEGHRHAFHHFGAGTFLGAPTFLSKYFILNPVLFVKEMASLGSVAVYADRAALVTTPVDMLINQALMNARGMKASCGIGISETMQRSTWGQFRLTLADLLDFDKYYEVYKNIVVRWLPYRCAQLSIKCEVEPYWDEVFLDHVSCMLHQLGIVSPKFNVRQAVFEGAQGLLLDQDNLENFPFVTHSSTGLRNVRELASEMRVSDLSATYVSRSYLTRHGAGPLPRELPLPEFVKDETNIDNPYQGPLRYAPLDVAQLEKRIAEDAGSVPFDLAITCADQQAIVCSEAKYTSWGPTRRDVHERRT